MTKKLHLKTFSLVIALFVAIFTAGTAFAWFTSQSHNLDIGGFSAGAYFAYGNGAQKKLQIKESPNDPDVEWVAGEDDISKWDTNTGPFGITVPAHMFNLAWLQNTGRFDDTSSIPDDQFYFELADNVDMYDEATGRNVVLPPIGNSGDDGHPFAGVFDGNGYTISHLVISTNKNVLYGNPASANYEFSNAVGLFGMTTEKSVIKNFILYYPTVEVSDGITNNSNTKYAAMPSENDPATVGLAIGYVAGKVQSIGVLGGSLAVRRTDYTSYNSILGTLSPNAQLDNNLTGTGPGGGPGMGSNFGGSFDVETFSKRLLLMEKNRDSATPSPFFPVAPKGTDNTHVLLAGEKMPFSVAMPIEESNYEGAKAIEQIEIDNIGYVLGSETKLFITNITLMEPLKMGAEYEYKMPNGDDIPDEGLSKNQVPAWFYTKKENVSENYGYDDQQAGVEPMTIEKYKSLPDDIRTILPDGLDAYIDLDFDNGIYGPKDGVTNPNVGTEIEFETIRLGANYTYQPAQNYGNKDPLQWSYHGQISWMGKTYGKGFRDANGNLIDENGNIVSFRGFYNQTTNFHEYREGIALPNNGIWFKPSQAGMMRFVMLAENTGEGFSLIKFARGSKKRDPKSDDFFATPTDAPGDMGIIGPDIIFKQKIPAYMLFYFEYYVSPEEIDMGNVEYLICMQGDTGAHFVYMDIGTNANGPTDQANPNKTVTSVDFIYDNISIAQKDITDENDKVVITRGSFVTVDDKKYVETGSRLYIEKADNTTIVAFVTFYYRKPNQEQEPTIYYAETIAMLKSSNENNTNIVAKSTVPTSWTNLVDGSLKNSGWTLG